MSAVSAGNYIIPNMFNVEPVLQVIDVIETNQFDNHFVVYQSIIKNSLIARNDLILDSSNNPFAFLDNFEGSCFSKRLVSFSHIKPKCLTYAEYGTKTINMRNVSFYELKILKSLIKSKLKKEVKIELKKEHRYDQYFLSEQIDWLKLEVDSMRPAYNNMSLLLLGRKDTKSRIQGLPIEIIFNIFQTYVYFC